MVKYKDIITTWAGLIGAISGAAAVYLKDAYPEASAACGFVAVLSGSIVGYLVGKKVPE